MGSFNRQNCEIKLDVPGRLEFRDGNHEFVFPVYEEDGELVIADGKASELLDEAGFAWLSHYSSIDLLHAEYGLEVCGVHEEAHLVPIAKVMQTGFPQWHFYRVCNKDYGREPGWKFSIHMFPRHCGGGRCVDAD